MKYATIFAVVATLLYITLAQDCSEYYSCTSCTSNYPSCSWCPVDGKCQASIFCDNGFSVSSCSCSAAVGCETCVAMDTFCGYCRNTASCTDSSAYCYGDWALVRSECSWTNPIHYVLSIVLGLIGGGCACLIIIVVIVVLVVRRNNRRRREVHVTVPVNNSQYPQYGGAYNPQPYAQVPQQPYTTPTYQPTMGQQPAMGQPAMGPPKS
mmetsp:Transcript_6879/g.7535  ORF Transcript_6879/g.7535 Transcript_6879/m.7535 type:complete len:209 (+) Transcript_6879:40-666(+)